MTAMLLRDPPEVLQLWLKERQARGQDGYDEVWNGLYHVVAMAHGRQGRMQAELTVAMRPAADAAGLFDSGPVNIGSPDDYRVPDGAYFRTDETALWNATAAVVVEVVSPGDQSRNKFEFYYGHDVDEVLIVDPDERTIEWYVRHAGVFVAAGASKLLGLTVADLHGAVRWPPREPSTPTS